MYEPPAGVDFGGTPLLCMSAIIATLSLSTSAVNPFMFLDFAIFTSICMRYVPMPLPCQASATKKAISARWVAGLR